MPEDTKKQGKNKNDPKEQRKRRGRQPAVETKEDKEPAKSITKAPEKSEKPMYEPPPPEFYKNLKKETDEIAKITEEENSKYKKKEILSNWAKYEMPIESYEEIDDQENLGADYETLANTPLSIGGHFQFKHEKSWDENTGPSPYDKYFEINMDNLYTALSSIPFYERNDIEKSIFVETDIQNMSHRAMKFKQKYYNDKKYRTPEMEAQEEILKKLTINDMVNDEEKETDTANIDLKNPEAILVNSIESSDNVETEKLPNIKESISVLNSENTINDSNKTSNPQTPTDTVISEYISDVKQNIKPSITDKFDETELHRTSLDSKVACLEPKNPVIESPEDLEKWLDDFLDE